MAKAPRPRPVRLLARMARRGYPTESLLLTARRNGLPKQQARELIRRLRDKVAAEASRFDTLTALKAVLVRREDQIDDLSGRLRRDPDAPASAHTTLRGYLKDQQDGLVTFETMREKQGRNRFKPPEERER